jgi:phage tail-like protein
MPQVGQIWEGFKATEFIFVVDGVPSPGVTRCGPLMLGQYQVIEQPDGGSDHVHKVSSTRVTFDNITVERRVDGSQEDQRFMDWWSQTFNLSEGVSQGSSVRKNGQIIKRHNGVDVLTFLFYNAWIASVNFGDLEAGSDNLMTQTIELVVDSLELAPAQ